MHLLYAFIIIFGISIIAVIYNLLRIVYSTRLRILERITDILDTKKNNVEEDPYSLPFKERIILPVFRNMEKSVVKLAPYSLKIKEQQLLKLAGYPHNLSLQEWMTWRMIIWLSFGGIFSFISFYKEALLTKFMLVGIGWMLGYMLPIFYLKRKQEERKVEIERGLPYVLDILTVSVDAGLGFDAALTKVVDKTTGTLSNEINKTLQEIKMGKSRREALRDLGEKSGSDDMKQFVASIIQAEQLGVSIGKVLRVQSEDMREKKKQRSEEKAMKAPIKILFPLILFIFPAIFIIILGPAVINMINTFLN